MSIEKDAKVHVGIEGTEDVAGAADKALGPWERRAQQVGSAVGGAMNAVGSAVGNVIQDLARVGTALGALDMQAAVARYRAYADTIQRQSVVVGQSVGTLKQQFADLQAKTALPDERIQKFSTALQRSTYDTGNSAAAIKALNDEAIATGRSLEEMGPLGTQLHNSLGVAFDAMPNALGAIRHAADESGESVAALQDQVVALAPALARLNTGDLTRFTATMAQLGKGLPPELQKEVQQRVINRLSANPEGLRHQLGMKREDFYDQYGRQRMDDQFLGRVREMAVKRWGKNALDVLSQGQNLGPMAARALMGFEPGDVDFALAGKGKREAASIADQYLGSEAGKSAVTRAKIEAGKRESAGGPLSKLQDFVGGLFENHPLAGVVGSAAALNLTGGLVRGLFTAGARGGGSVAMNAVGGGLSFLGGGSALLGGGVASLMLAQVGLAAHSMLEIKKGADSARLSMTEGLTTQQRGRVGALVRAAERAAGTTPEEFQRQLGPTLAGITDVRNAGMPGFDPRLAAIRKGLETGELQAGAAGPDLVNALKEAMKGTQLEVVVHIQDDSGNPNLVTASQKGAPQ